MTDSHDRGTDPTTGELVNRLAEQTAHLVRSEMRLAQAEMTQKAKSVGIGVGLFGAAGLIALYGVGALIATLILVLALVMDAWLASLVVTVAVFAVAGVAALIGRREVSAGTPLAPEQTKESVKLDLDAVKEARR